MYTCIYTHVESFYYISRDWTTYSLKRAEMRLSQPYPGRCHRPQDSLS